MDEMALIREIDPQFEAFAELYRRNITRVYRYHMVHVGDADAAEDLTMQTFMAALKEFSSFQREDSVAARILEIAMDKCLRDPRWRRREFHDDVIHYYQVSSLPTDKSAAQQRELESVSRALKQISSDRAEAISLYFFGELTNSEISSVLKKNAETIGTFISGGLEDLRARISRSSGAETMISDFDYDALLMKLRYIAARINPDPLFESELEETLAANYQPKTKRTFPLRQISTIIGWVMLLGATFFLLNWRVTPNTSTAHRVTARPSTQDAKKTAVTTIASTPHRPTTTPTATDIPLQDYTVQAGDTCTYIANKFGLTIDLLISINHLNTTCDIWADQKLKIPTTPISTPSS
jgi:RNA polymerase sigma-70 factor (ECF subfamily)